MTHSQHQDDILQLANAPTLPMKHACNNRGGVIISQEVLQRYYKIHLLVKTRELHHMHWEEVLQTHVDKIKEQQSIFF